MTRWLKIEDIIDDTNVPFLMGTLLGTFSTSKIIKKQENMGEPFMIVAHIIVMVMPFLVVGELINEYGI